MKDVDSGGFQNVAVLQGIATFIILGGDPGTMKLQVYFVLISALKTVGRNGNIYYNI